MAISLQNLVRKDKPKVPIMCIYGAGGMGKTTLASEFPNPIFIQTEDGANGLGVTSFSDGPLDSFADVDQALQELASEPHDFKTLVIDSVTKLEPMIWAETCRRHGWQSIEDPGFGKGYVEADAVWREYLAAITWLRDNKGMAIVQIGHESVQAFNDPTTDSYDRYAMRFANKRTEPLIREHCDVLGFLNQITTISKEKGGFGQEKAKGKGSGQRALNLTPRPAFMAKQRPGYNFPDQILINPGAGFSALAPYLPDDFTGETAATAA